MKQVLYLVLAIVKMAGLLLSKKKLEKGNTDGFPA